MFFFGGVLKIGRHLFQENVHQAYRISSSYLFYALRESIMFTSPIWVQPTVTIPIGDHVNVLHDYKKTGPSKILKLLSCHCHHLIDMLVGFCQNHIFITLLKWLNMPYL